MTLVRSPIFADLRAVLKVRKSPPSLIKLKQGGEKTDVRMG